MNNQQIQHDKMRSWIIHSKIIPYSGIRTSWEPADFTNTNAGLMNVHLHWPSVPGCLPTGGVPLRFGPVYYLGYSKQCLAIDQILVTASQRKFAHTTIAVLPWYVQNFVVIEMQ